MKLSQYILPTLKEDPADAVVTSHKLMTRAGLIRKESAGMYVYLPLGFKALRKVTEIVREEMDKSGALEFLMPELTNALLWKESGRWETMGPEMFRIADRNNQQYALGPTHEEAFTNIIRATITSYKELPVNVYQINTKFRDEIRPRFGVIRCKEFIMKDAYSFDINQEGLQESYEKMRTTYRNIFKRCGLETIPVQADSGNMGGSASEEFMVASEVGEEALLLCDCGYRANQEKAESSRITGDENTEQIEMELVDTPDVKTIEDLEKFFNLPGRQFLKSIIYLSDQEPVMVVLPGNREVNEHKLKNFLGCTELELAPDSVVEKVTNAPVGFAGPVNELKARTIFDLDCRNIKNAITGANQKDKHYKGVNAGRDFEIKEETDLINVIEGDLCPECQKPMYVKRGIEVGHIFQLGYKYTESMNVTVLDQNGKAVKPIMGCYGIGVTRTLSAVIEQHNDENGLIWPMSVAPYQVHLVGIAKQDDEKSKVENIYNLINNAGIEVLYDDRKMSPGVKFANADLIGLPIRITAGKNFFNDGELEIKMRKDGEIIKCKEKELIDLLQKIISQEMAFYK